MKVVDTNILVYAAQEEAPEYESCHGLLQQWIKEGSPFVLTWGIIYEFLRLTTHPRVLRRPFSPIESWGFLDSLCDKCDVGILVETTRHAEILASMLREFSWIRGNLVFDARTVVLMRGYGIKTIYTRDKDFCRFPDIEAIDPIPPTP